MTKLATKSNSAEKAHPVVLHGEERGKIWERARGIWKHRKPDPIKEHKKISKELDRNLPAQLPPPVYTLVQGLLDDPRIPVYVSTIIEAELFSHTDLSEEEAQTIDAIL